LTKELLSSIFMGRPLNRFDNNLLSEYSKTGHQVSNTPHRPLL